MQSDGDEAGVIRYVDSHANRLREAGAVRSQRLEEAFRRVPRHLFVGTFYVERDDEYLRIEYDPSSPKPEQLETIYSGVPLVTHLRNGRPTSSSSDSGLVARMLELLQVGPGMKVLEIGTGTGYNAALLACLTGDESLVTTVDYQEDVVSQSRESLAKAGFPGIRVVCADGFCGDAAASPYDRIIVTVGCPEISPHWAEQLGPLGLMLIPLRHGGMNPLVAVSRSGNDLIGKVVGTSGFMAIQGELADSSYYGPEGKYGGVVGELPVWTDLREEAGTEWLHSRHAGFWFHLGVRDRRAQITRWPASFGLVDPASHRAASVERNRIVRYGESDLLEDLSRYHEEWSRLGTPRIPDYTLRFLRGGDSDTLAADHWIVQHRYYKVVFSLER